MGDDEGKKDDTKAEDKEDKKEKEGEDKDGDDSEDKDEAAGDAEEPEEIKKVEYEESEAGANVRQICEKIVTDFKDKMRPHLSDFRRKSRQNLSRDVCYTWAKLCKLPSSRKPLKQKLTKTDKCLIAALTAVSKRKWDLALLKLKCAQGPDPEPKPKKKKTKKKKKDDADAEKSDEGDEETKDK